MGTDSNRYTVKLKAATLLESVIAIGMVSAALSFGIAMAFSVIRADTSAEELEAWAGTELRLEQRLSGDVSIPGSSQNTFICKEGETPYSSGITQWSIEIWKGDRLLVQRKCLIPIKP
jgi:type II secretory pathway pseudopilin PulG